MGCGPLELAMRPDGNGKKPVVARYTMTPYQVANPDVLLDGTPYENPRFPLPRADARIVTFEAFRPPSGCTPRMA